MVTAAGATTIKRLNVRFIPHIIIVFGICLLAHAAYDEHRGIVRAKRNSAIYPLGPDLVERTQDPKRFRNIMASEWILASIVVCIGFIFLGIDKKADRIDPFSTDFDGNDALDELDQKLTDEQKKPRK